MITIMLWFMILSKKREDGIIQNAGEGGAVVIIETENWMQTLTICRSHWNFLLNC